MRLIWRVVAWWRVVRMRFWAGRHCPAYHHAVSNGGIAELGVYVSEKARGQGIGGQLLASLIKESEAVGIWLLQAAIFPENKGSIQAHQKAGFRIVGMREKMGKMTFGPLAGQWRDVVLMERRSQLVGVD